MKINSLKYYVKIKYIPNGITISRIILLIPLIMLLELNNLRFAWFILIIGGLSDYLDGYLAKKLKVTSTFGAIIDPLADKLFILIPFIWLCAREIIPFWSLSLLLCRELIITTFRTTKSNGLPASKISKYKSFLQFLSLLLLISPLENLFLNNLGLTIYYLSLTLSIFSFFTYLKIE